MQAQVYTDETEIRGLIDAAQPAYARDDTKPRSLRRALVRLQSAETTAVPNEGKARSFRRDLPQPLITRALAGVSAGTPAAACAVAYAGAPPVPRGAKRPANDGSDGNSGGDGNGSGSGGNSPPVPPAPKRARAARAATRGKAKAKGKGPANPRPSNGGPSNAGSSNP